MLKSYFEKDEIIYLYRSYNGKHFSMKDILILIFGIIFLLIAIISIVLSFFFTIKLLYAALLSFICEAFMLGFYYYNNKDYFTQNDHLDIEYAITNKRFIICEKVGKRVFHIPIMTYYKVFTRAKQTNTSKAHLVLRLDSLAHNNIPLRIHNEDIEITDDSIVIYNVEDAFLLEYQLKFLFYVNYKKIKDIYDSESFLIPGEHIVHIQELKKQNESNSSLLYSFFIIYPIIFIVGALIHSFGYLPGVFVYLAEPISLCYILLLLYKGKGLAARRRRKNNYTYIRYIFTNKRILFLDYANLILYAFKFEHLEFVNLSNYNALSDTGDIFLSNYAHHIKVKLEIGSNSSYKDNTYDLLFPTNYLDHLITFNFDVMDCPKIRLYSVKSPQGVIDNYINKHIKNHETIRKMQNKKNTLF